VVAKLCDAQRTKKNHAVGEDAPRAERQEQLHVLQPGDQHRRSGTGAPAFGYNVHARAEFPEAVEREAPEVFGVFVKGMTEGRYEVQVAVRHQHATDLLHHAGRIAHMFQHGMALDESKLGITKRQLFRVGGDIHSGNGEEVEVHETIDFAASAAYIEIPPAEWKIFRLGGIHDERRGRLQQTADTIRQAPDFRLRYRLSREPSTWPC
jgi:hypothetical protein